MKKQVCEGYIGLYKDKFPSGSFVIESGRGLGEGCDDIVGRESETHEVLVRQPGIRFRVGGETACIANTSPISRGGHLKQQQWR